MRIQIFSATLATLVTLAIPATAIAASFQKPDLTDDEYNQLISNGQFNPVFVAEARIGNNGNSGDREFGITAPPDEAPVAEGQRVYTSGQAVPFTVAYDGETVEYVLGGQTLTSDFFRDPVDIIYLRNRSQGESSISLTNLAIDNVVLADEDGSSAELTAVGNQANYAIISDFSEQFTLSGDVTLSDFDSVGRSQLATQIKVGTSRDRVEPVPEPLTILGTGTALGLGILLKKKASQRKRDEV
ncbi:MAG: PEP-CTERM sorting domain-containing protein [Cyanophyceae cyanobacterium]